MATSANAKEPGKVTRDNMLSIYSAVFFPGLIPGINPPCCFICCDTCVGSNAIAV